jgi:hypothetical protein
MARNAYVKTVDGWEQIASTILAVPQGLVPVVPTSVAGTGVSFTGDGLVSFSASSSISLNGVFTSAFDNYQVIIDFDTASGNTAASFRMRAAGVDSTSSTYIMAMNGIGSGGAAAGIATTGSSGTFTYIPASYPGASASFTIIDPAVASTTKWLGNSTGSDTGYTTFCGRSGGIYHNVASAYDGFTVIGSANLSGKIRVYGYSKGGTTQSTQLQPFSQAAGSATITLAGTSFATTTVTFPVGRFTQAPILNAFKTSIPANSAAMLLQSAAPTTSGVTISAYDAGGISRSLTFTLHWQAIQMTSASATG